MQFDTTTVVFRDDLALLEQDQAPAEAVRAVTPLAPVARGGVPRLAALQGGVSATQR
jgi:energy-converting hydrogenase Eha subunit F